MNVQIYEGGANGERGRGDVCACAYVLFFLPTPLVSPIPSVDKQHDKKRIIPAPPVLRAVHRPGLGSAVHHSSQNKRGERVAAED